MSVSPSPPHTGAFCHASVLRCGDNTAAQGANDCIAVEEPLEIRLRWQREGVCEETPLTITMRTPGNDADLLRGLLFSEGIIRNMEGLRSIEPGENSNTLIAMLADGHQLDLKRYQRQFVSSSSCGVCGKMAIESLRLLHEPALLAGQPRIAAQMLQTLPQVLRAAQPLFRQTGGVHAAGLFSVDGSLLLLREDIGRHNAVDKLVGAALQQHLLLQEMLLVVSGRAGFEIVQKALMADIPCLAAVGAPTSLAVEMAQAHGMTLIGFLKDTSFNCYSGATRLLEP